MATTSEQTLQREADGCVVIMEKLLESHPCACSPPGLWLRLAEDTLRKNGVEENFVQSIFRALSKGRGKAMQLRAPLRNSSLINLHAGPCRPERSRQVVSVAL